LNISNPSQMFAGDFCFLSWTNSRIVGNILKQYPAHIFSEQTVTAMPRKPKLTPEDARKDHRSMLIFLGINALLGIFIGLMIAAALIYFDIGGFGTRVAHSSKPFIAILLVGAPLSLMLGGASMSTAIMMMPYEKKYDD
jgi:hypothetical protein